MLIIMNNNEQYFESWRTFTSLREVTNVKSSFCHMRIILKYIKTGFIALKQLKFATEQLLFYTGVVHSQRETTILHVGAVHIRRETVDL